MQAVAARTGVFAPGSEGSSHPIGATLTPDGLNVSVYAKRAAGVDLLLFDDVEDDMPARVIDVGQAGGRTGPYWHAFVPGSGRGRRMPSARAGHRRRSVACGSILMPSSSTRMAAG